LVLKILFIPDSFRKIAAETTKLFIDDRCIDITPRCVNLLTNLKLFGGGYGSVPMGGLPDTFWELKELEEIMYDMTRLEHISSQIGKISSLKKSNYIR